MIKFYIPKDETIPMALRLIVNDVAVKYSRIDSGFRFWIDSDNEEKSKEIAKEIIEQIKSDHYEPEHGISWDTVSFVVVKQDERYKIGTIIDWTYRVRDSF